MYVTLSLHKQTIHCKIVFSVQTPAMTLGGFCFQYGFVVNGASLPCSPPPPTHTPFPSPLHSSTIASGSSPPPPPSLPNLPSLSPHTSTIASGSFILSNILNTTLKRSCHQAGLKRWPYVFMISNITVRPLERGRKEGREKGREIDREV